MLENPVIIGVLLVYGLGVVLVAIVCWLMAWLDWHDRPTHGATWWITTALWLALMPTVWFILPLYPVAAILHARRKARAQARAALLAAHRPPRKAVKRAPAAAPQRRTARAMTAAPASVQPLGWMKLRMAGVGLVLVVFVAGALAGVVGAGSAVAALVARSADFTDYSFAIHTAKQHAAGGPSTEDLARAVVPQYMQPQASPAPTADDVLAQAADPLAGPDRLRMAGVFQQAAALIRDRERISSVEELNRYLDVGLNGALGSGYERCKPFMKVWAGLANDLNVGGQLPTMAQVATFVEGTAEVLRQ